MFSTRKSSVLTKLLNPASSSWQSSPTRLMGSPIAARWWPGEVDDQRSGSRSGLTPSTISPPRPMSITANTNTTNTTTTTTTNTTSTTAAFAATNVRLRLAT